jgi:hypothetical protein
MDKRYLTWKKQNTQLIKLFADPEMQYHSCIRKVTLSDQQTPTSDKSKQTAASSASVNYFLDLFNDMLSTSCSI